LNILDSRLRAGDTTGGLSFPRRRESSFEFAIIIENYRRLRIIKRH
jgi:hypothetical protein